MTWHRHTGMALKQANHTSVAEPSLLTCDPFQDRAPLIAPLGRQHTVGVNVGGIVVGGDGPVVVQSMTNTDTADVDSTVAQVAALAKAGSELVRITVDRDEAAAAVPKIKDRLDRLGIQHMRRNWSCRQKSLIQNSCCNLTSWVREVTKSNGGRWERMDTLSTARSILL